MRPLALMGRRSVACKGRVSVRHPPFCPEAGCDRYVPCTWHPDAKRPPLDHTPPHPEQRTLHAPGMCALCDQHPIWQQARIRWHLPFTLTDADVVPADG